MIFETIHKTGFHLPSLSIQAFKPPYLKFTISGYVRILAVMTGIEVFANLVPAYSGTNEEKSRKAFNSLLIVMFTSVVTMLIIGPAIFSLSDPTFSEISVFTQTMDILLPQPLAYFGSFIGIFVLMSACAASAQGLQNLSMGLIRRGYTPLTFGAQNKYEVADKPVWLQVMIVSICFLLFGTHEKIYLGQYAAGVFVILSLTGWAVTKRLLRGLKEKFSWKMVFTIGITSISAL